MLNNLPYVGIHRERFHFLKGKKEDAVSNFFSYSAKSHKAFPGISVLKAEKSIKVQFSGTYFFCCCFYAFCPETELTPVKQRQIRVCKSFRIRKAEISVFEFLSEKKRLRRKILFWIVGMLEAVASI